MAGGYMGKILDLDLSTGKIGTFELSDRDRERFIGGMPSSLLRTTMRSFLEIYPISTSISESGPPFSLWTISARSRSSCFISFLSMRILVSFSFNPVIRDYFFW